MAEGRNKCKNKLYDYKAMLKKEKRMIFFCNNKRTKGNELWFVFIKPEVLNHYMIQVHSSLFWLCIDSEHLAALPSELVR